MGQLGEDPAQYLLLAQSLATGQGYRDLFFPGHPPHVTYPFIFPALLAPIIAVAGMNFWWLHVPNVVCGALVPALTYALVRLWEDRNMAVLVVVFAGLSPFLFETVSSIISDVLYLALSLLAVIMLDRHLASGAASVGPRFWLALGVVWLAEFTRTVGISLAIGVLIVLWRSASRRPRRIVLTEIAAVAVVGYGALLLWWWRSAAFGVQWGSSYLTGFIPNVHNQQLVEPGTIVLWQRVAHAAHFYAAEAARLISLHLEPLLWLHAPWIRWVVVLVIVISWLSRALTRWSVLEWYVATYIGIILLWPYYSSRYLLPLMPGILYYGFAGTRRCAQWIDRAVRVRVPVGRYGYAAVVTALVLSMAVVAAARLNAAFYGARHTPMEERLLAAHRWVRDHLPREAVLFSTTPGLTSLLTGCQVVGIPLTKDARRIEEMIGRYGIGYVVVNEWLHDGQETLRGVMRADPSRWEALATYGQSGIVRWRGERAAADEAGSR